MAKKMKATHRTTRPHNVIFDPACHAGDYEKGERVKLPSGTHVIPSEAQLANLPDRFQSLTAPEPPADLGGDDDDEGGDDDDEGGDDEDEPEAVDAAEAHAKVDAALEGVGDEWSALTASQLEDLADGYEIEASDIKGSGSGGNVLKADWIRVVQGARGAVE